MEGGEMVIRYLYIFTFSFVLLSGNSLAQNSEKNCETQKISGFYIIAYDKTEIKKLEKNLNKRDKGKPYSLPIDYSKHAFFVEVEELTSNKICERFGKYLAKELDTIFIKSDERIINRINRMFCKESKDLNPIQMPKPEQRFFYSITGDSRYKNYCFEIYKVSGTWTKLSVENNISSGGLLFGRHEGAVNPKANNIITYLMHEPSQIKQLAVEVKGSKLWRSIDNI